MLVDSKSDDVIINKTSELNKGIESITDIKQHNNAGENPYKARLLEHITIEDNINNDTSVKFIQCNESTTLIIKK